jgi:hypothetical protein
MLGFHLLWRLQAFVWMPLNLSTWPGACFEASAIASGGCLAIWLVLADGVWWRRFLAAGLIYAGMRLSQDAGVMLHHWRLQQVTTMELEIFREADFQTVGGSFVAALLLRWLTGWRLTHMPADATPPQFKLVQLFGVTGMVAVLFAVARSKWFKDFADTDSGIIFLHSSTITLAILPALCFLLSRPLWTVPLTVFIWLLAPVLISGYYHVADWFPFYEWELIRHIFTTVIGPAVTATSLAIGLRHAGYRLRTLPSTT